MLLLAMARLLNEYRVLATARARPGAPLPRNGDTLVGGIDVWLNARYRRDAVESTDWQAPEAPPDWSVWRLPGIPNVPLPATEMDHRQAVELHNRIVGAEVRRILGAQQPRAGQVDTADATTARGAIGLAYAVVSEDPDAVDPDDDERFVIRGLTPPWRVSTPGAVHAMVWLLAAAYIREAER